MPIETTAWDVTEHLGSPDEIAAFLHAVIEDGDEALLRAAIGDIARAKGMTELAKNAGLTRTTLYRALSPDGNPSLRTMRAILKALGMDVSIKVKA